MSAGAVLAAPLTLGNNSGGARLGHFFAGVLLDNLSCCNLDCVYNQTLYVSCSLTTLKAQEEFKLQYYTEQTITVDSDPSPLNTEQQKLYNVVTAQYKQKLSNSVQLQQLLLNVNSVTGSRKTFTVFKTCVQLQEVTKQASKGNLVVCTALTGVTAFNIVSCTLYSLFQLPVSCKTADLLTATLQLLQAQLKAVQFLVINKKSIINLKMLLIINNCLQQIFLDTDQLFSRLNILLCRDFFQLLPVTGCLLFATKVTGPAAIKG